MAKACSVRRVEALRPRAQEIADGLVDAMPTAGAPTDLVKNFGLPLPITVSDEDRLSEEQLASPPKDRKGPPVQIRGPFQGKAADGGR